ncbi:hypothetical protein C6T59_08005 [Burkholderia multivorans]|nr:hypothetical protein [Burkholderia multivorans]PRE97840.1 hypothetical protein C6Q01_24890 [Burkholderia multivorans]PRG22591.1 hypothetical protein C6Q35_16645 [Burkholderia multivorans]PRG68678.1 hypothetical protein C6T59_08005 [Burkholderia multivorans]
MSLPSLFYFGGATVKFSHRHGFDPTRSSGPIVDDAPEWLRREYLVRILNKLTYVDMDSRYKNQERLPLGIKALNERLSIETRRTMDLDDWDTWNCSAALENTLLECEWYQFYDCVETVGEVLRETEPLYENDRSADELLGAQTYEQFGFAHYRDAVNGLFGKHNVGWRMNAKGELETALPKDLAERVANVEEKLTDEFQPARVHYSKARAYILGTQKDPENSIKESISAVESVCRVLYPKAATLGKAILAMRTEGIFPPKLLTVLERFYEYGNDEPGIRHGGRHAPNVRVLDAEFALHICTAFIRYVIETKKLRPC